MREHLSEKLLTWTNSFSSWQGSEHGASPGGSTSTHAHDQKQKQLNKGKVDVACNSLSVGAGRYYLFSQKYECNRNHSGETKIVHKLCFLGFYPRRKTGLGDKEEKQRERSIWFGLQTSHQLWVKIWERFFAFFV